MHIQKFRRELTLGLGRIILYLKETPALTYRHLDAIADACIRSTAYDPQCDESREAYLWEVIQLSKASSILQERILDALGGEVNGWDLLQVYRLAKIFASHGNPTAVDAMKKGFRYDEEWNCFIGGAEIIEAEGARGFLFVAKEVGKRILSSGYEGGTFVWEFAKEFLGEEKAAALLEESANDERIQAFYQSALRDEDDYSLLNGRKALSYDEFKSSIEAGEKARYPYIRWGMHASKEDLFKAADDLLKEEHPKKLEAYLFIFAKTAFPLDPQKIIELAQSGNKRLRSAAIHALRNLKDERIHRLAVELIHQRETEMEALELFTLNYEENDLPLLERIAFKKHHKHSFHNMELDMVDIFENHPTATCQKIMIELYHKGLCTLCRRRAVEIMLANHILPASLRDEIRYDCNPDIRDLWMKSASAGLP
ncbi:MULTISPECIES: hypothetical protein [unclassified Paenibacillus]|uniref:hypothetical protein n=1 Tax=unclassified Paenibacillus TaxID=185978 RepID=UPI00020D72B4|nr:MULTISPECIES: hypothetical protein [unclassified Paenibacillus]EGL16321.1 hypothetical protein HMPREF9413_2194 [Paenibacillus sp. HGF7]EPD88913.1 hypothetical protein HMPREF1207_01864 [Paenibacillus sp. HGH0039]